MNWLVMSFMMSIGTLSYQGEFTAIPLDVLLRTPASDSYQSTLGIEAQGFDNHVFVGGSVQTWMAGNVDGLFSPSQSLYVFNAGFRGYGFEFGWRHECDHITLPNAQSKVNGFSADKDEFYLSYKASVKVF